MNPDKLRALVGAMGAKEIERLIAHNEALQRALTAEEGESHKQAKRAEAAERRVAELESELATRNDTEEEFNRRGEEIDRLLAVLADESLAAWRKLEEAK